MKIASKLNVILGSFLVLIIAAVGLMLWIGRQEHMISRTINLAGAQRMLSQKMSKEILLHLEGNRDAAGDLEKSAARFERVLVGLQKGDAELGLAPASSEVGRGLAEVAVVWAEYKDMIQAVLSGGIERDDAIDYVKSLGDELLAKTHGVVQLVEEEAGRHRARLAYVQFAFAGFGWLLMVAGWFFVRRTIVNRVRALTRVMAEVADGNLSVTVGIRGHDELGAVGEMLRDMIGRLTKLVCEVRSMSDDLSRESVALAGVAAKGVDSVEKVLGALGRITKATAPHSPGSERSAGLMEEMAKVVDGVASGTQSVVAASTEALAAAESGGGSVEMAMTNMNRIRGTVINAASTVSELGQHSERVGQILQVIREIADQTNMLALNAAIEAARAGEHGKGFAVVADEVRKLAERSARATKDIGAIIETMREKVDAAVEAMKTGTAEVDSGAELAGSAGMALAEILQAMEQTNIEVQNISAAAQQAAASVTEVVRAIDEVAAATGEHTDVTHEVKETASLVAGISANLQSQIHWLRTGESC